jgi:rubrerythrin
MPYGIKNETPEITGKMERCVSKLMSDPNFKPKNPNQDKKTAAIMVCKSSIASELQDENLRAQTEKMIWGETLYCDTCKRKVIPKDGKCPLCGKSLNSNKKQNSESNLGESTEYNGGRKGNVPTAGKQGTW